MKHNKIVSVLGTLTVTIIFLATSVYAGDLILSKKYEKGGGSVNWTNGDITASGVGVPPANARSLAQGRAMAERAAVVVARRNLLEIVKGVSIQSETLINNGMVHYDSINSFVNGFIQGTKILKIQEYSDGSVNATVGFNMRGEFTDRLLSQTTYVGTPNEGLNIDYNAIEKRQVQIEEKEKKIGVSKDNVVIEEDTQTIYKIDQGVIKAERKDAIISDKTLFTGIIFDASKLQKTQPCLSPKVVDMDGKVVYDSSIVSREFVIKRGMAGYVNDIENAHNYSTIKGNPLVVKAIQRKSSTTLVISNKDAETIRNANKNSGFLQQAKVVIVL
ncbi:MAG: hypothetical protein HQK84_08080 [Nitrospinae bacterium]|nr:hypothetical protein [Nitrospinota bacterium]